MNKFVKNFASIGFGGIYIGSFTSFDFNETNIFQSNEAPFAKDIGTTPLRMSLTGLSDIKNIFKVKRYQLNLIPGISQFYIHFNILDKYDQVFKSLTGR